MQILVGNMDEFLHNLRKKEKNPCRTQNSERKKIDKQDDINKAIMGENLQEGKHNKLQKISTNCRTDLTIYL